MCVYSWIIISGLMTMSLADELLQQLELRLCTLSATLKPAVRRSTGDDPPTEKVALIAHGTCPKSSFCHTCVHSNHPSVAPVSPCTAFSAKKEGGGAFKGM